MLLRIHCGCSTSTRWCFEYPDDAMRNCVQRGEWSDSALKCVERDRLLCTHCVRSFISFMCLDVDINSMGTNDTHSLRICLCSFSNWRPVKGDDGCPLSGRPDMGTVYPASCEPSTSAAIHSNRWNSSERPRRPILQTPTVLIASKISTSRSSY